MTSGIDELHNLSQLLHQDVETCLSAIRQEPITNTVDLFWRRAYVRSVFAFIEGITYSLKLLAFEDKDEPHVDFSPAELAFLLEEDFDLNDKGEVVSVPAKISFAKNIRFAFRAIARANSVAFELKVSDAGWEALKKAAKVRDRLMHPKTINDLVITNDDIELVLKGSGWFVENFKECLNLVNNALREELARKRAAT